MDIALLSLSAICLLCAWLVPRWLRKRWEAKFKKKNQGRNEDIKGYATLGELPADYLDKALERAARIIVLEIVLELKKAMWQTMFVFLAIMLAVIGFVR